jgi:large subunit ribosomal protein L3
MIGLIGRKLGQTRIYDEKGAAVPVTVVEAGPNYVVQKKTVAVDGYDAVQLGFGPQKDHRLGKPRAGHLAAAKVPALRRLREFRNFSLEVNPGDQVGVTLFAEGDFVDAIGITKGRGFEGVVKRHGFRGGDMTHGAKGWHRRPGAIGQRLFPGTVMRGTRMPGHMGQVRRTVQNLRVVKVLEADQLLLIRGAIPGASGEFVIIREAKKRPKNAPARS